MELSSEMRFLHDLAEAVVEASRVRPGESVANSGPNTSGGTLIRPGGRDCYPAFWIRDFEMSVESGLITTAELEHALLTTARHQQAEDWHIPTGSDVPRGAIPDHITFDGKPIFFPGGIDDYEHQGGKWGRYPSLDDHYFFIDMAWRLVDTTGSARVLSQVINGIKLIDRLELAFSIPTANPLNGLVWCDEANRGVSFGFTDTIIHTGDLLFCSLLKLQAARQMAEFYGRLGEAPKEAQYQGIAFSLAQHIPHTFHHPSGLLKASTGKSAQPDVWGSAFAVYSGALQPDLAGHVCRALARALANGTIACKGAIRHVPTDADFSADSAWDSVVSGFVSKTYQNGAYWSTPTGWVCYAIAQVDLPAARQLALDLVQDLRIGDFRQGSTFGAPYECHHPVGDFKQNAVYLASVTAPWAAFTRLGWT
jgi:hypothetical protein